MRLLANLKKAVSNPQKAFSHFKMLLKTSYYRIYYKLFFHDRVTLGAKIKIFGKLSIKGPGSVNIGDNVNISMKVTPWTYDKGATIIIGKNAFLNGTKFGCKKSIIIGDYAIIGESRIQDTNFHSLYINRHDDVAPIKTEKVIIGRNVWIAPDCQILPGVTIGDNSVIGINSVVNNSIPPNSLAAGNPAIKIKTLTMYPTDQEGFQK